MIRILAAASLAFLGLAACTPAENDDAAADTASATGPAAQGAPTVVETREVQAPPVVIEREVQTPPVVIERDGQPTGDSTTVRAGRDGIEVETTNR